MFSLSFSIPLGVLTFTLSKLSWVNKCNEWDECYLNVKFVANKTRQKSDFWDLIGSPSSIYKVSSLRLIFGLSGWSDLKFLFIRYQFCSSVTVTALPLLSSKKNGLVILCNVVIRSTGHLIVYTTCWWTILGSLFSMSCSSVVYNIIQLEMIFIH